MNKIDYYKILCISKNSSDAEIKKAYKRLAMKYHPDRNRGDVNYENKFKEIKEAYEVLSDKKKRSIYDRYGHEAFNQNTSNDYYSSSESTSNEFSDIFSDVFGDIFGNSKKKYKSSIKGSDILFHMELNLEDAVKGVVKEINVNTYKKCSDCYGSGIKNGAAPSICNNCNGKGNIYMKQGFFSVQQTCNICDGEGSVIKNPCNSCYGNGRLKSNKILSIKVPSGINNGDRIRLSGEGEYGQRGGKSGDLYIQIKILKHTIFDRKGDDLYCEVPINFVMAALGGEIDVPAIDGKIKLKIPSETQTGKLFRMRGKGVKSINNNYYGDLICKVVVETPIKLNNKQKKILLELEQSFGNPIINRNSPKLKTFLNSVKKFFDNITKI